LILTMRLNGQKSSSSVPKLLSAAKLCTEPRAHSRARGRPKKPDAKVHTHIRLSPQVLGYFRATGPGWQTRIEEVLRKWVQKHRRDDRPRMKRNRAA